ncbi:MAG: vitamin K epoxide reductase family protein [Candidatus Woesearchaeota archaeon]
MDTRQYVTVAFIIASIVNFFLSVFIYLSKIQANLGADGALTGCFLDGGCGTVQTSHYATTLGISNPLYGVVAFFFLTVFFTWSLFANPKYGLIAFVDGVMALGTLFSVWLLYVQYIILQETCIYCLWVDSIMIGMFIVYFAYWRWFFVK